MKGFGSVGAARRFPSAFRGIPPHARPRRHLPAVGEHGLELTVRFTICNHITGTADLSATAHPTKGLIMANPFEDPDARYVALVNDEGQYSLWPAAIAVPAGWTVAVEESTRAECLAFIEEAWTDMRPLSLVRAMSDV